MVTMQPLINTKLVTSVPKTTSQPLTVYRSPLPKVGLPTGTVPKVPVVPAQTEPPPTESSNTGLVIAAALAAAGGGLLLWKTRKPSAPALAGMQRRKRRKTRR
jgi:LPXTG-motif cell wall-anchored protein